MCWYRYLFNFNTIFSRDRPLQRHLCILGRVFLSVPSCYQARFLSGGKSRRNQWSVLFASKWSCFPRISGHGRWIFEPHAAVLPVEKTSLVSIQIEQRWWRKTWWIRQNFVRKIICICSHLENTQSFSIKIARVDGTVFIFDLKNLRQFPRPIKELLSDPTVVKVVHSFKCDLLALQRTFAAVEDFTIVGLADTFEINHSLRLIARCPYKNLKFKTICQSEFGIFMDEFDFSNGQFWAMDCRKFSPKMVAYAARDALGCVDVGLIYHMQVCIKHKYFYIYFQILFMCILWLISILGLIGLKIGLLNLILVVFFLGVLALPTSPSIWFFL